jgi:phage/plasmid-like protein (TIGR03299 family)
MSRESFHSIPNDVPYEFAELLLGEGFKYETGISLRGGALNALTLLLDEPFQIPGDDSEVLAYYGIDWAHDGSGALGGGPTSVRRVCANTVGLSIAEQEALGVRFSIRHTKNWRARVADAKAAMQGLRQEQAAAEELGLELASYYFSEESVREFIERFTAPAEVLTAALTSERVKSNIRKAQNQLGAILRSPTVPEAHRGTGWGLYNAAVEYVDYARGTRGSSDIEDPTRRKAEALVSRTLLGSGAARDVARDLIRTMVDEGSARRGTLVS